MTHLLLSLGVLLFSFNLHAFELSESDFGQYKILGTINDSEQEKELNCRAGETIAVEPTEGSLVLSKMVQDDHLVFANINQGISTGAENSLYHQEYRTYIVSTHFDVSIVTEQRNCSKTLGSSLGCFSQEWKMSQKVRFFKKVINGVKNSYIRIDYRSGPDDPVEYCMLKKVADGSSQ